jgi:hypothetical protein
MLIPAKPRGLLSGTVTRGTLTRGLNRPQNTKHVLSNRAHKGLQSLSNPKGKKGSKKAQLALSPRPDSTVQPIRTPSNPRNDLRLTRGLPTGILDDALQLCLTRG